MWLPDRSKLIKVLLHSRGEDVETAWAQDEGPTPGSVAGTRRVRLANVPFLHAKPTYGDLIRVIPDDDGMLSWDSQGVPFERIGERILEDGGRWAMILAFSLRDPQSDLQKAFSALDIAAEKADIAVEGCFAPSEGRPGRAYLAVPAQLGVDEVLAYLEEQNLPLSLELVHPRDDEEDE